MAEAAYATGPALLGAPRFWGPRASLFYFFSEFFVFCRGPKEPKSPRKLEAPKIDPKRFLFVPCFSVSAQCPKEPKVPRKRYRPQKFKNGGPKMRGPKRCIILSFFVNTQETFQRMKYKRIFLNLTEFRV
jgi:hypothetical protein